MNYISPIANEIAWHHAVEKLLGIELTPRCKYIRTILAELARISDHLLCVGAAALDLGGVHGVPLRASTSARRSTTSSSTPPASASTRATPASAALLFDVNDDVDRARSATFVKEFPEGARRRRPAAEPQPHLHRPHARASASCRRKTAINLSCTGPIARASGVVRDLRKDEPYLAYKDFDFKVDLRDEAATATPATWSAWRRCCESLKIIEQAVENLPAGPGQRRRRRARSVLPDKTAVVSQHRGADPALRADHAQPAVDSRRSTRCTRATESPNGELGFYIVARRQRRGRTGPGRGRRRSSTSPMFPHLIEGHQLSDVVAVLGSLNIIAAELDR